MQGSWLEATGLGCLMFLVASSEPGQTYEEAANTCTDLGGYVLEPQTAAGLEGFKDVAQLIHTVFGAEVANFWLGMKDDLIEGGWYWPLEMHAVENTGLTANLMEGTKKTVQLCLWMMASSGMMFLVMREASKVKTLSLCVNFAGQMESVTPYKLK